MTNCTTYSSVINGKFSVTSPTNLHFLIFLPLPIILTRVEHLQQTMTIYTTAVVTPGVSGSLCQGLVKQLPSLVFSALIGPSLTLKLKCYPLMQHI